MKKQIIAGIIIGLVVAVGVVFILGFDPEPEDTFDNEGRYDSTVLNDMGVIYADQADIEAWNNGYSESDACPWGAEHNGLDYMFYNNSPVISAAPGLVEDIEVGMLPDSTIYVVGVIIRFNSTLTHQYAFEGNATTEGLRDQQVAMLDVEIGDWVVKGEQIGRFLRPVSLDHVHFAVYNPESICPRLVLGVDDYNEIMSLIESFHLGENWQLCYP